jgi:prevent-host-death family protein
LNRRLKQTTVTAAYAKAHLPALLAAVAAGQRITISRYNRPVAELGPYQQHLKPVPRFGTLKGKVKILDPNWAAPLTAEEIVHQGWE